MNFPPVGNDIVDLDDEDGRLDSYDTRFAARACHEQEWADLAAAPDRERAFWRLWTAKESAFKLAQRERPELSFRPSRFHVRLSEGLVACDEALFQVRWRETREYILCWAYSMNHEIPSLISSRAASLDDIEESGPATLTQREAVHARTRESRAARILAKDLASKLLRLEGSCIEVLQTPPQLWYENAPLAHTGISISHHGRYVACAIAVGSREENKFEIRSTNFQTSPNDQNPKNEMP